MKKVNQQKGFTLIEIIAVIAIIAALAAIAIPVYRAYTVRSAATDIIVKHEELREMIYANATEETSSCSDLLSKITPDFLEDNYANLAVDFVAVKDGYSPVLRVCAEFDTHGKLGIEASKDAYNRFVDMKIASPTGSGEVLGESMVTYSVPLAVDDAYLCTDYRPQPASGKGCGSQTPAPPPAQPAPSSPPPAPRQAQPAPSPSSPPEPKPKLDNVTITEKPTKDNNPCPEGYVFVPDDDGKPFDGTPQTGNCKEASKYQKDPYAPVECYECAGPIEICERIFRKVTCEWPNNICVIILKNKDTGGRTVIRRCGNHDDAHDWYYFHSDSDRCQTFDSDNIYTLEFECTYACTDDECNKGLNPILTHRDSMWTPP